MARNDTVLYHDRVEKCLTYVKAAAYCQPPDAQTDNRKWMIYTERFTGRHRDMLMEIIDAHLGTHHLLSSPTPVTLHRISGEREVVLAEDLH